MNVRAVSILSLSLLLTAFAAADDAVHIRVVDVGAGLCCVAALPGGRYVVYDAGNYEDRGATAEAAIAELIPAGEEIDLLVLSHTDSDHVAAVPWICENYAVKRVIRPGMSRDTVTWNNAVAAIRDEREEGCIDINLGSWEFPPGATYRLGDAFVTMISGFSEPPHDWEIQNDSERMNAGSIIIRLLYKGRSVLLCGDAVGRHNGDPPDSCIDSEKFMIDMSPVITIDSDVMVAPHHGADNGSSTAFIRAVSPEIVIFSAGHRFDHPRLTAAQRYLDAGVPASRMFRTDRGDDESAATDSEWPMGRIPGHRDLRGDDDVEITIDANGFLTVQYRVP